MALTPLQGDLLLDLFEHCMLLELTWQRKEQAEASGAEAADHLCGEYDAEIERHNALMNDCAIHGVPAERVAHILDTYLPANLQSVEEEVKAA